MRLILLRVLVLVEKVNMVFMKVNISMMNGMDLVEGLLQTEITILVSGGMECAMVGVDTFITR